MNAVKPKAVGRFYSEDDLAVMWCRLNSGRHPVRSDWRFNPANIAGAMAFIVTVVGPTRCLNTWRKQEFQEPEPLERRKVPR